MKKANVFCKIVILFLLAVVFSCSQDPIFYTISTEPVPQKPRIEGGPTNVVVFEREYDGVKVPIMYVASGRIHWYAREDKGAGASRWDTKEYNIPQPSGKIIGLAATDEHLYALCLVGRGVTTVLRRIGPAVNEEWQDIQIETGIRYTSIQSIYADKATGRLFAGVMSSSGIDYGILYLDDTTLRLLQIDTEMLSGLVSRQEGASGIIHYLSTRGRGVFMIAENAFSSSPRPADTDIVQLVDLENADKQDRLFMGLIKLEDESIIAVERNGGALFEVTKSGFTQKKNSNGDNITTGKFATGALALWQQITFDDDGNPILEAGGRPPQSNPKMLIAGIQGGLYNTTTSSYTHGYVEFELTIGGALELTPTRSSISPNISVDGNTDRYTATIGKHPINYFYQTSSDIDLNMTFFASTQTAGLWSYRNRTEGWQWNAEN